MAQLTAEQKRKARNLLEKEFGDINYSKTQINAVWQELEDLLESASTQTAISNAIDAGTSPLVLTNPQKKKIAKIYFTLKGTL